MFRLLSFLARTGLLLMFALVMLMLFTKPARAADMNLEWAWACGCTPDCTCTPDNNCGSPSCPVAGATFTIAAPNRYQQYSVCGNSNDGSCQTMFLPVNGPAQISESRLSGDFIFPTAPRVASSPVTVVNGGAYASGGNAGAGGCGSQSSGSDPATTVNSGGGLQANHPVLYRLTHPFAGIRSRLHARRGAGGCGG